MSVPVSFQTGSTDNSTPSVVSISNNSTNLIAPSPPFGFSARLEFNSSMPLKPLEVYVCAIELMSFLCNLPWSSIISLGIEMSGETASTAVFLTPYPPFSGSRLQVRYAVLGLYAAGVAIAQGNQFYDLDAVLYMGELEVGWLDIGRKGGSMHEGSKNHLLPLKPRYANDTTMVMASSARLVDPDDSKFVLTFSWDGARIKAQDIFTVVLDSLAIAAEHNNTDLGAYIPAARSTSGDTVLSTWAEGEGENAHMTWARLKRALVMIWDILVLGPKGQKPRFEGLVFGLEYEGKEIGAGRMLRFDTGSRNGGSAVEK